jgi:hypothetical protein
LTASAIPARFSRTGRRSIKALSLMIPGRRESAHQIFQAQRVDRILDADAAVILSQHGGGKTDMANAAVKDRCRIADCVQHRAAADRDHKGMPIDRQF